MILRDAQIQRDGHGKSGLLPNSTLSSKSAQLPNSGVPANTRRGRCNFGISHRYFTPGSMHVSDSTDQKPFHVTRVKCRGVRLPHA